MAYVMLVVLVLEKAPTAGGERFLEIVGRVCGIMSGRKSIFGHRDSCSLLFRPDGSYVLKPTLNEMDCLLYNYR